MKLKINWQMLLIPVLMALMAAAVYSRLPEQIPMHFNSAGAVDRYGSRISIFLFSIIAFAIALSKGILPKIDPRQENYSKFHQEYSLILLLVQLLLLAVQLIVTRIALGYDISINRILPILTGALLSVCGNYMPRFRQNYFCGIKTPWTLTDETVWFRTHRLGGKLMFAGGVLLMLISFLPTGFLLPSILLLLILMVGIPFLYSYLVFKQLHSRDS